MATGGPTSDIALSGELYTCLLGEPHARSRDRRQLHTDV